MTASDFVAACILKATGKSSSAVSGDKKWLKVLGIGNQYIDNWSNEPGVDWGSLYTPELAIGTVTATDSFSIPTTVRKVSDTRGDFVRIDHVDGGYTNFEVVSIENLKRYYSGNKTVSFGNYCAQDGTNLVFNRIFQTIDPQFGGTIKVPVYSFPAHLSADSDVVPVDNPMWLVTITAAEYVRNDITRSGQYPNLVSEANQLMQRMKDDNEGQVEAVYMVPVARGQEW